jgi:hypothetical protein
VRFGVQFVSEHQETKREWITFCTSCGKETTEGAAFCASCGATASRFQKLEKKVAEAQSVYPGAPAEQWQSIADEIASGRQVMAGMPGLTDQNELGPKQDSVQKAYMTARKTLRAIIGKEEDAGD